VEHNCIVLSYTVNMKRTGRGHSECTVLTLSHKIRDNKRHVGAVPVLRDVFIEVIALLLE
jgi:hypothetical protein